MEATDFFWRRRSGGARYEEIFGRDDGSEREGAPIYSPASGGRWGGSAVPIARRRRRETPCSFPFLIFRTWNVRKIYCTMNKRGIIEVDS